MKRTLGFLALALVFSLPLIASPIREGSLSAVSNGNTITIRWLSEDETGVVRYEIERKSGLSGQFVPLVPVAVRGNNTPYEFIDDSAFLRVTETIYQYQIRVVYGNSAQSVIVGPITVRHDVSSVRRTWGSIKAMFR
jgi:hypothetical protein